MDFHYTDYTIVQEGQDLKTDSAIKIQKYENKVSRLIFKVEDWLKERARLYVAILNPETKRYHYEPLLPTDDGEDWYLMVGTSISYYVGKTKLLLIGVEPSFILDDNITLDPTATVYVSKEFPRIVVLENFLDDISVEVSLPNLDIALDNLMVLHENAVAIGIQTAQDLVDCNEILQRCEEILATVTELEASCATHDESCGIHEGNCISANEHANTILEQNEVILGECNDILSQARTVLSNCNISSSSASSVLSQCQSILSQCQTQLSQITTLNNTMTTQYNAYMSSMREAFMDYIEQIQNGGNP